MYRQVKYRAFLRDVAVLSVTTFGGPQTHIAHFQRILVEKRRFLSEEDLLEINALCQVLPGPTSTQTLCAIGYRIGGPNLAYLTLLIWMLPAVILMTLSAFLITALQGNLSFNFTRFVPAMAVGFVSYAAYSMSIKSVTTRSGLIVMILAGVSSYFIRSPFYYPAALIMAGLITAMKYKAQPKEEKIPLNVRWENFLLWGGVLIAAATLGHFTDSLPIRLFENFYRNGSLIFGGGQVLTPLLYTEFVELKHYLDARHFLSGYAIAQAIPGPVFSFSAYLGALSMQTQGASMGWQCVGAFLAAAGIFLPGTFLIFFLIRFWDSLKKYRVVRASLEGITAASAGLVAAAAVFLFQPLDNTFLTYAFTIGTFILLNFTRIPAALVIVIGLLLGLVL